MEENDQLEHVAEDGEDGDDPREHTENVRPHHVLTRVERIRFRSTCDAEVRLQQFHGFQNFPTTASLIGDLE